jgi:hypothetical protein
MTRSRSTLLVLFVSVAAYVNSLGNTFTYDDRGIVERNPVVTTPLLGEALLGPYWPDAREGTGLYRPVVVTSFALEWRVFGGSPLGFHAMNVVAHAMVSVFLMLLLTSLVPLAPALAGALLFAVHPLHVEAVANVVGRSELYAAGGVLLACHLYVTGAAWTGARRGLRLLGITLLYLLALGSKEIAVTLPALLVALELVRRSDLPMSERLRRGLPVYASLAAVLIAYLILRTAVLGALAGQVPAPTLRDLSEGQRVLTALSLWPEYLRLLLFPLDLIADYSPAVITPATGVTPEVAAGAMVLVGLATLAWLVRDRAPMVALGIGWFLITVVPVSNLVIPAGILLAERTLYLPSVGLSMVAAGLVAKVPKAAPHRTRLLGQAFGLVVVALLFVRTVLRNPTWFDTYTMMNTLAIEHPESYLSLRSRGTGLARVGDVTGARQAYEAAVALSPLHYSLLVEVGEFYGSRGRFARAEELLVRAVSVTPEQPAAYRVLAEYLIRQDRGREGHRVALTGLARAEADPRLWALVSESYIAKGDLEAAARARLAALALAPESSRDWGRLAEIYEAMGRTEEALDARRRQAAAGTVETRGMSGR